MADKLVGVTGLQVCRYHGRTKIRIFAQYEDSPHNEEIIRDYNGTVRTCLAVDSPSWHYREWNDDDKLIVNTDDKRTVIRELLKAIN